MTIAIGLINADGITVATDRQYSFTTSASSKRMDAEKITPIRFKNTCAVVAESGDVLMSKNFVTNFERRAAETIVKSRYTVSDLAQETMRATKRDLCDYYGCGMIELDERFDREGTRAQCIIASVFEGQSFLHTIYLSKATAERVNLPYISIGSGGMLAEYLLKRLYEPQKDPLYIAALAAYIVRIVEDHDLHCGGRPNIVTLTSGTDNDKDMVYCSAPKPEIIDEYIESLLATDAKLSKDLREGFYTTVAASIFKRVPDYDSK